MKFLDDNPVLGNIVLALVFGLGMLGVTLKVFSGHQQLWLYVGFSFLLIGVVFVAGTAHDRRRDAEEMEGVEIQEPIPEKKKDRIPRRQRHRDPNRQLKYANYANMWH